MFAGGAAVECWDTGTKLRGVDETAMDFNKLHDLYIVFVIWVANHGDSSKQGEKTVQDQTAEHHAAESDTTERKERVEAPQDDKAKRRQALALAFAEVMRQQGHEVSVSATSDQLWFDCSTALEPRSSCYAAYQSSKHLPSNLKAELRAEGITTLNFSPNGQMIPTWATNIN